MLKALELVGFKSFADKTRFEFPAGITVVVGPNGSGKSNIVDAIKWVLGEQSAKSLRGKDMADVIFKGSGGNRRELNTAEATIVFDNSEGRLPVDTPEVLVTRRVYRSGEGEYLINREPCRLKDIRNLFRGTGVGTDAYSLIEQGKVDQLLQASSKDRRAIFEEAAGISRFKAKKLEALRRLERVELNLTRLSDIVDEVESRLRSVRNQASKAKRYRDYSERLQQLRTQVASSDWRKLTDKLNSAEADLSESAAQIAQFTQDQQQCETAIVELDGEAELQHEAIRSAEQNLGVIREAIAADLTTSQQLRDRSAEWAREQGACRARAISVTSRAGDIQSRLATIQDSLAAATDSFEVVREEYTTHEQSRAELETQVAQLREQNDARRKEHMVAIRQASELATEINRIKSQLESQQGNATKLQEQIKQVEKQLAPLETQVQRSTKTVRALTAEVSELANELEAAERELAEQKRVFERRHRELAAQRGRLSGREERAGLLQQLEARREGIGAGATALLKEKNKASNSSAQWLKSVHGIVADVLRAHVDAAPLVDLLLGDRAQYLVTADDQLQRALEKAKLKLQGRVGIYNLQHLAQFNQPTDADRPGGSNWLQQCQQIAPANSQYGMELVEYEAEYDHLVQHLFSDIWVVDRLPDAVAMWNQARDRGIACRLITKSGDLIQDDGTWVAGPQVTVGGLVSRRSELDSLREDISIARGQIDSEVEELERLNENISHQQQQASALQLKYRETTEQLNEQKLVLRNFEQQSTMLRKQVTESRKLLDKNEEQSTDLTGKMESLGNQLDELQQNDNTLEAEIQQTVKELETLEQQRHETTKRATELQVELAKREQEVEGLRGQIIQIELDQQERERAVQEAQQQVEVAEQRQLECDRELLSLTATLATSYLTRQQAEVEIANTQQQRQDLQRRKAEVQKELQAIGRRLKRSEAKHHEVEVAAGELKQQRIGLAERLRDDYGIELATLEQQMEEEDQRQRSEVDDEIEQLRRKINNIGAVNMEALHELEDLENRFQTLHGQYTDLRDAKEALERIIVRINADSRRLFLETLEAIRVNFQDLYRKAFGGGQADLVLEEGVDPLDAGVDIIATPPGKPSFNNSLLSGGEKALTAVSLLLAIFQFRPSPFCVLDEVDAPFDEANVGRFVDVLRSFLGWTKFVIVTHSKKTMTAATTLYGITMQESGVSKQVSVRFEDVSDDGQISEDAIQRSA